MTPTFKKYFGTRIFLAAAMSFSQANELMVHAILVKLTYDKQWQPHLSELFYEYVFGMASGAIITISTAIVSWVVVKMAIMSRSR